MDNVWVTSEAEGMISPFDRGLAYGDGLFATMRSHNGDILFLHTHLSRLQQGALRLGFDWQPSVELLNKLTETAVLNPNHCLKLLITKGVGGRGYASPVNTPPTCMLSVSAIPDYSKWQQQGISLAVSPVKLAIQPVLAGMKHLNRLEQVLIKSQTLTTARDEWLVVDMQERVIGASMANIFAVYDDHICTPPMSNAGISGVTRQVIIEQLLTLGFKVNVTHLTLSALSKAKAVFISNSLLHLVDVTNIEQLNFKRWSKTEQVRQGILNN